MIQIGRVNIVSKNAHRRFAPKVAELTGISGRIESEWVAELTGIRICIFRGKAATESDLKAATESRAKRPPNPG